MAQQIQIRRGTAAAAAATDPVLAEGEFGHELDTGVVKIGDGVTVWSALPVAFTVGVDADAQTAADVPFAPAGSIEATDVQAAIVELDTDLVTEAATRAAADSALSDSLTTEQTVRANADTALDGRLDTIETTLPLKADLVAGVVPTAQMPAIAIMERVPVANQAARLALTNPGDVQVGDVAVQADTGTTWLLIAADPSLAGSWKAIDQSDAVQSINGQTGTVVLGKADVGLGNVDNTADLAKPISAAAQTALDAKAPLASPALTGTPTAPTAPAGDNSTKIANTAFVKGAVDNATYRALGKVELAADAASIDFTDIDQNYGVLIVRYFIRSARADNIDAVLMRLNGDAAANYDHERTMAQNATMSAVKTANATVMWVAPVTAASAPAGYAGGGEIVLPGYTDTTFFRTAMCRGGGGNPAIDLALHQVFGYWKNAADPVTSLSLFSNAGANLQAGSKAYLYGAAVPPNLSGLGGYGYEVA